MHTLGQMDFIDIYRAFHLKAADCTFFSNAHETLSRIDHILGHKASLSKFRKMEILSSNLSNHTTMRLEIDYKKNYFFSFIFISWRLITLQYCSGFCHTFTWISQGFTCVPHPDPPSSQKKKKPFKKTTNSWRLSHILLNNKWTTKEIKEGIKNDLHTRKMKTQGSKPMGCSKRSSLKKVYSNTILLQETIKSQINKLTYI